MTIKLINKLSKNRECGNHDTEKLKENIQLRGTINVQQVSEMFFSLSFFVAESIKWKIFVKKIYRKFRERDLLKNTYLQL